MTEDVRPADIGRLLQPRSVAVIGGGTWCTNVIEQCQKIGYSGDLWSVHPNAASVAGVSSVRRVEDLPYPPDASFIGINRERTIETLRSLSKIGAGGAVCFASGFEEVQAETGDGHAMHVALLDAAGDMPVLGPNCYGFLNYLDGVALWPDQHGGVRSERGVAIIAQSSNIAINLTMQRRGLPVAYVITVGNQAQIDMAQIARVVLADHRVSALGLYVEGIADIRAFEAMSNESRARGKPIVALKTGRSEQARAASVSHTASLSGSDIGAQAFLRRLGIGQVFSLPAFLETLKLLHIAGPLPSNRIASMSCSGGEASLIADTALGKGVRFPPLEPPQQDALRRALGPNVALANPLDYHTYIWADTDALAATFTAMMQGDLAMGCVILDFPRADRCDQTAWEPVIDAVSRAQETTGRPIAVVSSLPETMPEDVSLRLAERGIAALSGLGDALSAIRTAAQIGQAQKVPRPLLLPVATGSTRILSEADAKAALGAFGLCVPQSARATTVPDAVNAANKIGYPVVLKGEGIAHKTEAGAVVVNLTTPDAVATAAEAVPGNSYLVEEMVVGSAAELLVGVVADPAHGYVLTLAAGGVLTELLSDSASLLVPASREEVRATLISLKVHALLTGYRGGPPSDFDAILDAVMAIQDYVAETLPLEVEINPLLCGPDGAVAADALIRIGDRYDRNAHQN